MNNYESVLRWWARLRGVALKWVWLLWQIRAPSCSCGLRSLPVEVVRALGSPSQWLCTPRVQWSKKNGALVAFFSFSFLRGVALKWLQLALPVRDARHPSCSFWGPGSSDLKNFCCFCCFVAPINLKTPAFGWKCYRILGCPPPLVSCWFRGWCSCHVWT